MAVWQLNFFMMDSDGFTGFDAREVNEVRGKKRWAFALTLRKRKTRPASCALAHSADG
jgi:hypothetical protein